MFFSPTCLRLLVIFPAQNSSKSFSQREPPENQNSSSEIPAIPQSGKTGLQF